MVSFYYFAFRDKITLGIQFNPGKTVEVELTPRQAQSLATNLTLLASTVPARSPARPLRQRRPHA